MANTFPVTTTGAENVGQVVQAPAVIPGTNILIPPGYTLHQDGIHFLDPNGKIVPQDVVDRYKAQHINDPVGFKPWERSHDEGWDPETMQSRHNMKMKSRGGGGGDGGGREWDDSMQSRHNARMKSQGARTQTPTSKQDLLLLALKKRLGGNTGVTPPNRTDYVGQVTQGTKEPPPVTGPGPDYYRSFGKDSRGRPTFNPPPSTEAPGGLIPPATTPGTGAPRRMRFGGRRREDR